MPKVLFTCALVVHLLIVSCTAGTTKPTKMPKLVDKLAVLGPLMDTILGRMGELFSDSSSPNAALSNDDYGYDEQIDMELFLEYLQQLLLTSDKLEKFSLGRRQKESRGQTIFVPEDLDDKLM